MEEGEAGPSDFLPEGGPGDRDLVPPPFAGFLSVKGFKLA